MKQILVENIQVLCIFYYIKKQFERECVCEREKLLWPPKITEMIKPYIPRIPAITTGRTFFITNPGFNTPIEAIPTPDFAVPYAAPRSERERKKKSIIPKRTKGRERKKKRAGFLNLPQTCKYESSSDSHETKESSRWWAGFFYINHEQCVQHYSISLLTKSPKKKSKEETRVFFPFLCVNQHYGDFNSILWNLPQYSNLAPPPCFLPIQFAFCKILQFRFFLLFFRDHNFIWNRRERKIFHLELSFLLLNLFSFKISLF